MNNLTKILGIALLGLGSHNLNAQHKFFTKEDFDKYCISYSLADINGDSINEAIVVDYDLNLNGKKDVRGLFLITGKREEPGKGTYYITSNKACMLVTDYNEDGEDDELFVDKDLDGHFDFYRSLKGIKTPKPLKL